MIRRSSHLQEILIKPTRPSAHATFGGAVGLIRRILSSPLVALVIAIAAWTIPSVHIQTILKWALAVVAIGAVDAVVAYVTRWRRYVLDLEGKLSGVRSIILSSAKMSDSDATGLVFRIVSLENVSGTVNLVIAIPLKSGLRIGSRLSAVVSETGEVWGIAEVAQIERARARVRPVDRLNVEFWERLEDRMGVDPAPPMGIHLEPAIDAELRSIIAIEPQDVEK